MSTVGMGIGNGDSLRSMLWTMQLILLCPQFMERLVSTGCC